MSRVVASVAICCLAIVNLHAALLKADMLKTKAVCITELTGWQGTRHTIHLHFLQVDNQLQHVPAGECCGKRCMPADEASLRTHGSLSIIRHRWAMLTVAFAWLAAELTALANVKCLLSPSSAMIAAGGQELTHASHRSPCSRWSLMLISAARCQLRPRYMLVACAALQKCPLSGVRWVTCRV